MKRRIVGFHTDEEGHWVAELECGHHQHVRHSPPWVERPWVTTEEGRASRIGEELDCPVCDGACRSDQTSAPMSAVRWRAFRP
jgi:Protein of unknown function (DUF3565)